MRCFRHPSTEAVGTCKQCSKGLCADCAVDLGHGLACKDTCEDRVHQLNNLINHSEKMRSAWRRNRFIVPIFFVTVGAVFGATGISRFDPFNFTSFLGLALVIFGLIVAYVNQKVTRHINDDV